MAVWKGWNKEDILLLLVLLAMPVTLISFLLNFN